MRIPRDAVMLRIYIGEDQKFESKPLFEAIVLKAREMQLAGATAIRGPMGFGQSSVVHSAKVLLLSEDLPIVIEIVDIQEKIDAFLPEVSKMMASGLITLQNVELIQY